MGWMDGHFWWRLLGVRVLRRSQQTLQYMWWPTNWGEDTRELVDLSYDTNDACYKLKHCSYIYYWVKNNNKKSNLKSALNDVHLGHIIQRPLVKNQLNWTNGSIVTDIFHFFWPFLTVLGKIAPKIPKKRVITTEPSVRLSWFFHHRSKNSMDQMYFELQVI